MTDDLTKRLTEHADWCDANEWEIPITLGDDLRAAAARIKALTAENAALRERTRWISVEEELPEDDSVVLVASVNDLSIGIAEHYGCGIFGDYNDTYDVVTHWMPLPEPPEEEK